MGHCSGKFYRLCHTNNRTELVQHDGKATLLTPPNTAAFDPANCGATLLPAQQKGQTSAPASDQFSLFAQLMTTVVGALAPKPSTPKHKRSLDLSPLSLPVKPEFGDLYKYLTYAQDHLGVPTACDYKAALSCDDYGPDIIGSLKAADLTEYGLSKGDAMHLIAGCASWKWIQKRQHLAVRSGCHSLSVDNQPPLLAARTTTPVPSQDNIIRYEYRWDDSGACT